MPPGAHAPALLHRPEALRPAVGGERGVELIYESRTLVDAARQHPDDLEEVVGQVIGLGEYLDVEIVNEFGAREERVDKALELAELVGVGDVGRLFHASMVTGGPLSRGRPAPLPQEREA